MPRALALPALACRLRPALAAFCAGLVLALTIFAASPLAHQWLHVGKAARHAPDLPAAPGDEADACAVVLFASGVALPVGPIAVTPPVQVAEGVSPVAAADVLLVSPRYLRQPERGPPADVVG